MCVCVGGGRGVNIFQGGGGVLLVPGEGVQFLISVEI